MANNITGNQKKKGKLSMRSTMILLALVPMIVSSVILSIMLINTSSEELNTSTSNSLVAVIKEVGAGFDYTIKMTMTEMKSFMQAPIVREALDNRDNSDIQAKAQEYTLDVFDKLEGWEGLYIADWGTTTLTHPSESMIGVTLREGDSLSTLQNSMLSVGEGVYNTGIITSPASGQLVMSMYAPIYDESNNPLGFIGAATLVNHAVAEFADVTSLGLNSAYIYFVDRNGTMLYHPDESKIGNPVENEAVKTLVARISNGEHPQPDCVSYENKGDVKYAAYYVGEGDNYIAVLTADEADVMAGINAVKNKTVIVCLICILLFGAIAIGVAVLIARPLTDIADAQAKLSTGDVTVSCNAKSNIRETISIIMSFGALKEALSTSMKSVKNSAEELNETIVSVDTMTNSNVDSVSKISVAINEVATTSQSVAENAQTMATKAQELGDNIETLNDNVVKLFDSSQLIKNANNDATNCMKSVYRGANESVQAMQTISDKISETNSAIGQIGSAVLAIESIAAQTNLLSLNASIEAARAGEAGRGFAVVADEIRTLADSSADSAKEIKQIIENIIELSNGTVEISNRVYDVIHKEQDDIENAQDKFNILSDSVEESIAEIDRIKQMTGKLDEIKVELSNATTELGAISEELGASAEEVSASCQTVEASCTETQNSTEEMRTINENLNEAIGFFKLS